MQSQDEEPCGDSVAVVRGVVSGSRPQLTRARVHHCGGLSLAVSIPVHQLANSSAHLPRACLPIGAAAAARGARQSKPRQQRGSHCVWRDGSHCVWRDGGGGGGVYGWTPCQRDWATSRCTACRWRARSWAGRRGERVTEGQQQGTWLQVGCALPGPSPCHPRPPRFENLHPDQLFTCRCSLVMMG